MGSVTPKLLLVTLVFLVLGLTRAADYNSYTMPRGPNGEEVLALAPLLGNRACNSPIFLLRSGTTNCIAYAYPPPPNVVGSRYGNYTIQERGCPSQVAGATNVKCVKENGGECFIYNPANDRLIQWRNHTVYKNFNISANISAPLHPTLFHAESFTEKGSNSQLFFLTLHGKFWRVPMMGFTDNYGSDWNERFERFIEMPFTVPTSEVNHFSDLLDNWWIVVAFKGQTKLLVYWYYNQDLPIPHEPFTSIPFEDGVDYGLTNIGTFAYDHSLNVYLYDTNSKGIHVYNVQELQTVVEFIPLENAKTISLSRNKLLIVDNNGDFIKQEEEHVGTLGTITPYYCAQSVGSVAFTVAGGEFPVSVNIYPDGVRRVLSANGEVVVPVSMDGTPVDDVVVVDDDLVRSWQLIASPLMLANPANLKPMFVNSSVIAPYSGTKSMQVIFRGENAQMRFEANPQYNQKTYIVQNFEYIEFWINAGKATQNFEACLRAFENCKQFPRGSLVPFTWNQVKFHLPSIASELGGTLTAVYNPFNQVFLKDKSGTTSQKDPIYIDYVKYHGYTSLVNQARMVDVYDACNKLSSRIVRFDYIPMKVEVTSDPISCHPNTTVSDKLIVNGALTASVTNAAPGPLTYTWSLNNTVKTATISGLPHMSNYITLYDEGLNKSWVDESTASSYSYYDTKYVRTGDYSLSFTPNSEQDALVFKIFPDVLLTQFPTLEFWVNGGDVGYQTLKIAVFKTTLPSSTYVYDRTLVNEIYGTPVANKWIKFSVAITAQFMVAYNTIVIYAYVPVISTGIAWSQPPAQTTLYIDDMVLVGKASVLTVRDSRNCQVTANMVRVTSPTEMKQSIRVVNSKCYNKSDGAIIVGMEGGSPPYTFSWSHDLTHEGSLITNLGETLVNVNITDRSGCQYLPTNATVLQPPDTKISIVSTPPVCNGELGSAIAVASGGSGIHTYTWVSSTGRSSVIPQPAPDAIFLDEPSPFFKLVDGEIVCLGTGSHLVNPKFTVSPSRSGYCTLSLFGPGVYNTTIAGEISNEAYSKVEFWLLTDDNEVFKTTTVTLLNQGGTYNPMPLESLGTQLIAGQWNKFQIIVTASATGVTFSTTSQMPTIYVDDFVAIPVSATSAGHAVLAGFQSVIEMHGGVNYYLTVLDSNGCEPATVTVNLPEPSAISISYETTSPSSNDANDASISVQATGGSGSYRFLWEDSGSTDQNAKGLSSGEFKLTVWDGVNCKKEFTVYVNPYSGIGERGIREYNPKLSSGLAALVGIGFLVSLFSATMLYRYWMSFSTLGSFLSCMILVGCVLSFMSALVLLPEPTDALCTSFIWFLGIGFVLVYGCLFIKTWALYKVWRNAVRCQKANLTPLYIIKCLCLAVGVEVIFLAIWTAVDPPTARLKDSINNTSEYQCSTDNITFWIIFLAVKGAWLIFGAVLSVLTRNIAKEYNESSSIAYAIYNNVLLCAIAIPLAALLGEVPGGRLTVEVVIICIAYCFTMVVVFFKIWHSIILPEKIPMSNNEMHRNRNTASSTGSMKSSSLDRSSRDSRGSSPHISAASRTESQSEAAV